MCDLHIGWECSLLTLVCRLDRAAGGLPGPLAKLAQRPHFTVSGFFFQNRFMTTSRIKFHNWFSSFAAAIVVVLGLALVAQDAEAARRLGGGKSFGRQTMNRDQATQPAKPPAQDAAKPAQSPGQATQPTGNRWMGPLAGIAAGLGIAALLSHLGLGGAFAAALGNILVIALLIFGGMFLWRMLKRSTAGAQAPPQANPMRQAFDTPGAARMGDSATTNAFGQPIGRSSGGNTYAAPAAAAVPESGIPADFDVEGFLRVAKVQFNRMQAAWDSRDLDDIRKFTTPEVFAEIKMQRDEDADKAEHHDVENLEAHLLGIETTADDYAASVRFSGALRDSSGQAESFEEVWNLVKPTNGRSGWLLGGIQQLQ